MSDLKNKETTGYLSGNPAKNKIEGMSAHLLIPVDFSPASIMAVRIGFNVAKRMGILPVLMHVYPLIWIGDDADYNALGIYSDVPEEIQSAIAEQNLHRLADTGFRKFKDKIKADQKAGLIPDIRFTSTLLEGIPEDVILNYCKYNNPRLVVMATRGVDKKEEDLIGSVTAEVLDSCRVPVFTIPDNFKGDPEHEFSRIMMLCTVDNYDIEALETMINTFGTHEEDIWMMPILSKRQNNSQEMEELQKQLSEKWPTMNFFIAHVESKVDAAQIDAFIEQKNINVIIAPNRKTSLLTRLFKPSVAHRCLFSVDLPMLALPVN